jgi:hypothetical protein
LALLLAAVINVAAARPAASDAKTKAAEAPAEAIALSIASASAAGVAAAAAAAVDTSASAPQWGVFRDQAPALLYGDPEDALISIVCGEDETGENETWIVVAVKSGTKPTQDRAVLVLENDEAKQKEIPLEAEICAADQCTMRAPGEVYRYLANFSGVEPALDIAEHVTKLSVDAPGAKISAPADAGKFASFAGLCRKRFG